MKKSNTFMLIGVCIASSIIEYFLFREMNAKWAIASSRVIENSQSLNLYYIATLPYIVFLFLVSFLYKKSTEKQNYRIAFYLSVIGVLFSLLSYGSASHGALGFLFLGYVWQWLVILRFVYLCYSKNT